MGLKGALPLSLVLLRQKPGKLTPFFALVDYHHSIELMVLLLHSFDAFNHFLDSPQVVLIYIFFPFKLHASDLHSLLPVVLALLEPRFEFLLQRDQSLVKPILVLPLYSFLGLSKLTDAVALN